MANKPEADGSDDHALVDILVEAGRISAGDGQQIVRRQSESGGSFVHAGEELGLLTADDVRYAVAHRADSELSYASEPSASISRELIALTDPSSASVEALRAVRSRLMLSWFDASGHGKALAVVSPQRGDGRSWFTANIGVLFAQLGERTLIIDADLRHPRQHRIFGLDNDVGLANILKGQAGPDQVRRVQGVPDLRLLTSGTVPHDPQETISRSSFAKLLQQLSMSYSIILIDTPALADVADAQTIAARAGSALFVTRQGRSKMALLDRYCALLQRSSVSLAGSVLIA